MGKHFLAEWKLKLSDMSIYAGIIAVLFVAGIGIQYIIGKHRGQFFMGTNMALFAMIFIAWFSFLIDFYMGFHLAVSYGRTRKNFLLSVIPVYAAYGFLFMAEVRLLAELERIILELTGIVQVPKWFHSNYISPGWLFLYAVLLTGIAVSIGTVVCRYKEKGIVAIVVLFCLLPLTERAGWLAEDTLEKILQHVFSVLQAWNPGQQAGILLTARVLLCAVPFAGLRKARVN